jgi:hypothetical protein
VPCDKAPPPLSCVCEGGGAERPAHALPHHIFSYGTFLVLLPGPRPRVVRAPPRWSGMGIPRPRPGSDGLLGTPAAACDSAFGGCCPARGSGSGLGGPPVAPCGGRTCTGRATRSMGCSGAGPAGGAPGLRGSPGARPLPLPLPAVGRSATLVRVYWSKTLAERADLWAMLRALAGERVQTSSSGAPSIIFGPCSAELPSNRGT